MGKGEMTWISVEFELNPLEHWPDAQRNQETHCKKIMGHLMLMVTKIV